MTMANLSVPVYQYYCLQKNEHEYSTRSTPHDGTWKQDDVAFYAFDSQVKGTVPVYEYYSQSGHDHEYTTRSTPHDDRYWKKQKVAFYAFDSEETGTVPVYQYYRHDQRDHEYTTRSTPYDGNWQGDHFVVFYAYPAEDELDEFTLHEGNSKLGPGKPIAVGSTCQKNNTSETQEMKLTYTENTTTTSSVSHDLGFKFSVKSKISAGVVFTNADLEFGLDISGSKSWTDSKADTKGKTVEIMVKAAPMKTTVASAMCHQHDMEVPYTLCFKSGRTVDGVWKGVAHSKVTVEYKFEDC